MWLLRIRRPRKADEFKLYKREAAAWVYRTKLMRSASGYILGVDIKEVKWENL